MKDSSNLCLDEIGEPALYPSQVMVIWGVISAATAGAESYDGLIAIRFFLELVQAVCFPGYSFFLSW